MKRFNSIKKSEDFKKVYEEKNSFSDRNFVLYLKKNEEMESNRLGISISKKVGNSCVRHTIVRRIREIFRKNENNLFLSYDIIIVVKTEAREKNFNELNESFIKLCKKKNIYKE